MAPKTRAMTAERKGKERKRNGPLLRTTRILSLRYHSLLYSLLYSLLSLLRTTPILSLRYYSVLLYTLAPLYHRSRRAQLHLIHQYLRLRLSLLLRNHP